jgi:protein tyrosine phosphatase (PTP) superfamily phosphohydrolase (DUF442 family)
MLETTLNFRQLTPQLATAGQPDKEVLQRLGQSGYEVVINLGLAEADYAVAGEQAILESQAIRYIHLPVSFQQPAIEDFRTFRQLLKSLTGRKLFIHCAANKRVSVFLALYRVIEEGWPWSEARQGIEDLWQPDEIWQAFIHKTLQTEGIGIDR